LGLLGTDSTNVQIKIWCDTSLDVLIKVETCVIGYGHPVELDIASELADIEDLCPHIIAKVIIYEPIPLKCDIA
jgi:hypothetical protein